MYLHKSILIIVVVSFWHSSSATCPSRCRSCDGGRVMCARAGLTSPPTPISEETYSIDLSGNSITSLEELPPLPNVQSMRMSMNKVSVIPGNVFSTAVSIMSLDLSMNKIHTVQATGLQGLESLLSISLNGNKLSSIGNAFEHIKTVTSIRLGNNQIEQVTENNFKHNTMIKMLDLSGNKINTIDENAFENLNMLRYLILSNNPIKSLPELVFTSTMLSLADFSNCLLEHVPRKMPPSLKDFRLGNNKITKIFYEDFQNITQLNLLTLNDNKISNVEHRSFKGLENLKELWMSRNEMVYIPRGLPKNLSKLHIDNNQLVDFQPTMFVEGSKLKHLSLEANSLQKMHKDALKHVNELEHLNLQGNRLSFIDTGTFTKQPALKTLTLMNNPIQAFETGAFADLANLTEISLGYVDHPITGSRPILQENFLSTMPNVKTIDLMNSVHLTKKLLELFEKSDVPVMDKVTTLNLQYNELTTLPMNIRKLFPHVENLWLDGNLFICDTKLRWLYEWRQTSTVSFYQYEEPTCDVPLALKGKTFSEISAADFKEIPKDERVHVTVPETPTQPTVQETPTPETKHNTNEGTNEENTQQRVVPNATNQPTPERNPPRNTANKPVSQSGTNQRDPYNRNRQPYRPPIRGTLVIIKPPRNSAIANTKPKNPKSTKKHKMTKAERKVAREAKRAAKKAERARKRKERQQARRRRHKKGKDARRKKRRIRNNGKKRCKLDKDGNMKCRKRKRCKVDSDGTVKCRKRKRRKQATNGQNTPATSV